MNKTPFTLTLASAFSLTLLAGCTMAPDYQRPALPVASNWSTDSGSQPTKADDIGWKQYFNQPAMHQLITMALANNRDLRVAALNVDTARASFQIDRAVVRSEEHTSELQSHSDLVCRL